MNLSPEAFWNLRLAEWRWLLEAASPAGDSLTLKELKTLANLYPDETFVRSYR
ncbi:MAG: phage tail assembly chaperone [Parvularculaceae bacterium]